MDYETFVSNKRRAEVATGHKPGDLNEHLFDFQHAIVSWAVRVLLFLQIPGLAKRSCNCHGLMKSHRTLAAVS